MGVMIDRAMERGSAERNCPLQFDRIEFGGDAYHEIVSSEKLREVLSYLLRTGRYRRFAGKTAGSNVYMDIKGRKPVFKHARSLIERNSIYASIRRYGDKLNPEFDRKTCLETAQCFFQMPEDGREKYRVAYGGRETFAFPMSNKNILGLYSQCISARQTAGKISGAFRGEEAPAAHLEGKEAPDILFQCLLLDDIKYKEREGILYADLCTIYC